MTSRSNWRAEDSQCPTRSASSMNSDRWGRSPMPEAIGLTSLSVEGFRAFARRQTFDLAASAVIVTGSNGTGKTSLFDAVQWLLLGSIPRLVALRTKRTDEYILNEYTAPKPARVEAEMLLAGNVVNLSR